MMGILCRIFLKNGTLLDWMMITHTKKILRMKASAQSENINSHFNREIERQKAIKALEKAKSIKRKVVFLPQGATGNLNYRDTF